MKKRHFLGLGIAALLPLRPAVAREIPARIWNRVQALRGILTQANMPRPRLHVLFDPNCPYSTKLWSTAIGGKPFHDHPSIWIPVAYLRESSFDKSAACLRSGKKEDLHNNFSNYDRQQRQGAIAGVKPTRAERSALDSSKKLWAELGSGTPMFVYRTRTGETRMFIGLYPEKQMSQAVSTMALTASAG